MKGHVRQYGKAGKWSYTVDVGKIDGKRKRIEKGGFNSKAEAEAALNAHIYELNSTGSVFVPAKMTFDELFKEFLEIDCALQRRPSTIKKYKSMYEHHVKDALGHRYITTITPKDIDKFTISLAKKNYSQGFIKSNYKFIAVVFAYAIKSNYIKEIPTDKAVIPKVTPPPVEILTSQEIEKMMNLLENSNLLTGFIIGLNTGMRVGEVFGLRWSDINFKNNTININKQILYENNRWTLGLPKTDNSTRIIKMSKALAEYLINQKEVHENNRQKCGEWYVDNKVYNNFTQKIEIINDFVNVKENGEILTSDSAKYISRVAKANGINFHFHMLRHPYVKHTTKKYNSEKQKTQTTNLSADSLGFLFLLFILRLCP